MSTKINKFAYDIVNTNINNAIAKKEKEINDNTIAFFKKKYQKTSEKLVKATQVIAKQVKELQDKIYIETKEISGFHLSLPVPFMSEMMISINSYNQREKHPAIIKATEEKQQILMKLALGEDVAGEVNALIKTINSIK